jgi:predicted alpha/beta-hydrolase family hydrolase
LRKPSELDVAVGTGARTTALVYAAGGADYAQVGAAIVLGHGAGASQHSAFMVEFAHALADLGIDVITFNFLYTERGRRLPDRATVLEDCYGAVIRAVREHVDTARRTLFIGGKSMGGRIATQVAAADATLPVAGLVLLGYPLHPPGQPDRLRDGHLPLINRPMLFVQGTRDAFGTPDELAPILTRLAPVPLVYAVDNGDHSFKLQKRDPARQAEVYRSIQQAIVGWIASTTAGLTARKRAGER